MLAQKNSKKNINRAAKINYLLRINGYTQRAMAKELGISCVWVSNVINGKGYNSKIDNWIKENLGI